MADTKPDAPTPAENAKTLGTLITVALSESAHALTTLRAIHDALAEDDIHKVRLAVGNFFAEGQSPGYYNTLSNLEAALYNALPRGHEQRSYG